MAAIAIVAAPATVSAQSRHRARLSRDLSDRIQQRVEAPTEVIVSASDGGVDRLVARYGARLKKRIHGGAVLEATGGQIDAMSQDTDVDHMAGNARVYRMMAVTTESTGADQVWAGLDGVRGFSGRGIGVAVIDSGVAPHGALAGPRRRVDGFHGRREREDVGRRSSTATARTSRGSSARGRRTGSAGWRRARGS